MAFFGAQRTLLAMVLVSIAATAAAQIWVGGYGRTPPRFPTETSFTGGFNFFRVSELTKIQVKMTDAGEESDPDAVVVRLTDEALFNCPFIFMQDAGTARFNATEVARLQDY